MRIAVLKDGILQQCAPPREIYDHPANTYVAGFIGSPKIKLVAVTLTEGRKLQASGFSLELPDPVDADRAILGIRPEALDEHPTPTGPEITMKVEVVEVLGSDQYLHGTVGSDSISARVDPHLEIRAGDSIRLGLDARRLHLFDAATERALPAFSALGAAAAP